MATDDIVATAAVATIKRLARRPLWSILMEIAAIVAIIVADITEPQEERL